MTEQTARRVADELRKRFTALVEIDEVRPGRFRFEVLSKHYGTASLLDRQDQAWEVVNKLLTRDEEMDVSIIHMLGPEDVDESLLELMP